MDRDAAQPRPARGYPRVLGELHLTEDKPEQEVVPGEDGYREVRLREDSGHLGNKK